jgi:alpha-1,3-mannosyltransferase
MRRFSMLARATVRPPVVFGFLLAVLLTFTYYLYAFPNALSASASRYFYPVPPVDPALSHVQQKAYALGGTRPVCPLREWHVERYNGLNNTTTVFLAVNFYNNQDILPNFFQELPVLLRHLGPERVYVSVFENGSTDHTPQMLALCALHIHLLIFLLLTGIA